MFSQNFSDNKFKPKKSSHKIVEYDVKQNQFGNEVLKTFDFGNPTKKVSSQTTIIPDAIDAGNDTILELPESQYTDQENKVIRSQTFRPSELEIDPPNPQAKTQRPSKMSLQDSMHLQLKHAN